MPHPMGQGACVGAEKKPQPDDREVQKPSVTTKGTEAKELARWFG